MKTWTIGRIKVTEVQEMPIVVGMLDGLITQATPEVVKSIDWLYPDYVNEAGQTLWDIHCYVVDTGEAVVLVDAGCGNGKSMPSQPTWGGLNNPFLERMAEAGYQPGDIDFVLCTHLHLDHVGWNTVQDESGRWVPTFPNSKFTVVKDEYDYHADLMTPAESGPRVVSDAIPYEGSDPDIARQTRLVWEESIQPLIDAGQLDLVPRDHQVVEGVRYESTPGHTLAHHGVRIESEGESAFVTGDFIHHPIQIAHPEWSSRGDWDGAISAASRRSFLEGAAGADVLVLGTHFTGAGAGYVVPDGSGFRLVRSGPVAS